MKSMLMFHVSLGIFATVQMLFAAFFPVIPFFHNSCREKFPGNARAFAFACVRRAARCA